MNRRITSAVLLWIMIFNGTVFGLAGYEIINLSKGSDGLCSAVKVNDLGQVLIESLHHPNSNFPLNPSIVSLRLYREVLLWQDDQLTDLGSYSIRKITGFNNLSQVLTSWGLLEDGQINNLDVVTGFGSLHGINDSGQIIGDERIFRLPRDSSIGLSIEIYGFLYDPIDGYMEIGPFLGTDTIPMAINNNGQIACSEAKPDGSRVSFIWNMNTNEITELGDYITTTDINNNGQLVGTTSKYPYSLSFLWDEVSGKIKLEPKNDEEVIYGKAINDNAQIVGYCGGSQPRLGPFNTHSSDKAFVWEKETGVIYLNDFLAEDSQWETLTAANDINNDGWIVGIGLTKDEQIHAFLMIPLTEPADILAFCLEIAIEEKLSASKSISTAIAMEWQATDVLNEMLETGELGSFKRSDIARVMTRIQQARMREEKIQKEIDKTIDHIEYIMSQLQVEE